MWLGANFSKAFIFLVGTKTFFFKKKLASGHSFGASFSYISSKGRPFFLSKAEQNDACLVNGGFAAFFLHTSLPTMFQLMSPRKRQELGRMKQSSKKDKQTKELLKMFNKDLRKLLKKNYAKCLNKIYANC
jgi:hypothetical protein